MYHTGLFDLCLLCETAVSCTDQYHVQIDRAQLKRCSHALLLRMAVGSFKPSYNTKSALGSEPDVHRPIQARPKILFGSDNVPARSHGLS